jgi:hypothetical protein
MSLLDKLKSLFSGGSAGDTDPHAGHDHSAHDHSHDDEVGQTPDPEPDPAAGDADTPR